jgi:hypothetical protein
MMMDQPLSWEPRRHSLATWSLNRLAYRRLSGAINLIFCGQWLWHVAQEQHMDSAMWNALSVAVSTLALCSWQATLVVILPSNLVEANSLPWY